LDALVDAPVDVVTCRHEASAAFMALADAKLTGRPALCLVNRAPGATNAAIGLHAARQDATPLLLLVGQVETGELGPDALQELGTVPALLGRAERPLLLAGSALSSPEGRRLLREAAERHVLPVVLSNKRQDLFDNLHPHYAGHLTVSTRRERTELLAQADLALAVGTRLDHVTTQRHRFPAAPAPAQPLVHVYPDPARLGFTYEADVALACDPVA